MKKEKSLSTKPELKSLTLQEESKDPLGRDSFYQMLTSMLKRNPTMQEYLENLETLSGQPLTVEHETMVQELYSKS